MPSNFLNDVKHKDALRKKLADDTEHWLKFGRNQITVGTPCIPVPRQPAKVVEKKMTLKQVAKKWREGFYGKDQT